MITRVIYFVLVFVVFNSVNFTLVFAEAPKIRISTPFSGAVFRGDVDASGKNFIVSNSKHSVTSWSLDPISGSFYKQTYFAPINSLRKRKAFAAAVHPDGTMIAYSTPPELTPTGNLIPNSAAIYIFDASQPTKILKILKGREFDIPSRPQALRFSPDGKFLAATLSSGCGLRLFSVESWKLWAATDQGYTETGGCYRGVNPSDGDRLPVTNSVAFLDEARGRPWIIVSGDTGLFSYGRSGKNLKLIAHAKPIVDIDLERPAGISLSPHNDQLLVGDRLNAKARKGGSELIRPRIALIDAVSLTQVGEPFEIDQDNFWHPEALVVGSDSSTKDNAQTSLDRVAWITLNGKEFIFGAGFFKCSLTLPIFRSKTNSSVGESETCIVRWEIGNKRPTFIPASHDRISDLVVDRANQKILVVSQTEIKIIDYNGALVEKRISSLGSQPIILNQNTQLDLRDKVYANNNLDQIQSHRLFNISDDGRVVVIEDYLHVNGEPQYLTFDIAKPNVVLSDIRSNIATVSPVQDERVVSHWSNNNDSAPHIYETKIPEMSNVSSETHRSVTINRENELALLGSDQYLRFVDFSNDFPKVLCKIAILSEAYRVNLTPDARIAVVGHADGTVRWYRSNYSAANGSCRIELILSAYFHRDDKSLAWTVTAWRPDGFFTRSYGAPENILWQFEDGVGEFKMVKFRHVRKYYRPDKVEKVLTDEIGNHINPSDLACGSDQKVLLDPSISMSLDASGKKLLKFSVSDGCGWPKTIDVRMAANNVGIKKSFRGRHFESFEHLVLEKSDLIQGSAEIEVVLPDGIFARQGQKQLCFFVNSRKDSCSNFNWTGPIRTTEKPRRLWAIFVGISDYADDKLDLRYSAKDAVDFAGVFLQRQNSHPDYIGDYSENYSKVITKLISSSKNIALSKRIKNMSNRHKYIKTYSASRSGILEAISSIRASAYKDADKFDDTLIFYFSGHAIANPNSVSDGRMLLALPELHWDSASKSYNDEALSSDELFFELSKLPGEKIVFFDACRTLPDRNYFQQFERGAVEMEVPPLTHVFFSGGHGQLSRESSNISYTEDGEMGAITGNGVFTYSILKALTKQSSAAVLKLSDPRYLRVFPTSLARYLYEDVFNKNNPSSFVTELYKREEWEIFPSPSYWQPSTRGYKQRPIRSFKVHGVHE